MAQATRITQSLDEPDLPSTEDTLRADVYRLIANVLSAPPTPGDLAGLASLTGDDTELGRAVAELAAAARDTEAAAVAEEYQDLFIGIGRGELLPYASYYLTGFLNEKPLAKLRQEMARLGIERAPGIAEPEDHAASVLDIMASLIDGSIGLARPLDEQRLFFEQHIANWMVPFFVDLARAETADFYRSVAAVGRAFVRIEEEAFRMR